MNASILRYYILAMMASAVIGLVAGMVQYQRTLSAAVAELREDAYGVTDHLELQFRSLRLSAEMVADGLDPADLATSGRPAMAAIRNENTGLTAILVIDRDGIVVDELYEGGTVLGVDVSDRAYFRAHQGGGGHDFFLSAPIRNRHDGAWTIPISVPIRDSDGAFAGVVTVGVLEGFFSQLKSHLSASDTQIHFRAHGNGEVTPLSSAQDTQDFTAAIAGAMGDDYDHSHLLAGMTDLDIAGGMAFLRESPSGLFDVVVLRSDESLRASGLAAGTKVGLAGFALAALGLVVTLALRRAGLRTRSAAEETRAALDRLHRLADNTPGALSEFTVAEDGESEFPYFNARLPEMMGISAEALRADGKAILANVPEDDIESIMGSLGEAARDLTTWTDRHRVMHPEKGLRWILVTSSPIRDPDGKVRFFASNIDITDQVAAEQRAEEAVAEVKRAHDRLTLVADVAPAGLYEFRRHPDGRIDFPYCSGRFVELLGLTRDEIERNPQSVFDALHPDDLPEVMARTEESTRTLGVWRVRCRVLNPERGTLWLSGTSVPRRESDGTIVWTGALMDVTADVAREEALKQAHHTAETMRAENEHQALHDGLTGLPNRRFYDKMLAGRLDRAEAGGARDCVLIRIDLDHFKYVNDTLGHEAGDMVLMRVADVLRGCLRGGDFAARIGGDEFSILMTPGTSEATAIELVDRVRSELAAPLLHDGRQCRFGASFGIAHTDELTEMGYDIQMFADAALYRAKEGGRSRYELFTPDLHRQIQHDRRLAVEIHEGLDNDEFVPFFQPQVAADDGRLVGIETLLRWNHPTAGLLTPEAFMNVAEHLRLVADIDRLMMEKSRDALARWRAQGLVVPKISFNVSSGRMHDPDVVALAADMAAGETRVTFELLESILVEEESDAFRFHLDMLREAGIDIEIDDFGSGHASIIGVMEIAPSALKIDKRIVLPVERDPRARNLVRAIVEIADTLGIQTVAEGVETEAQAEILCDIGCGVLQGFLFARPLSEAALLEFAMGADRRTA